MMQRQRDGFTEGKLDSAHRGRVGGIGQDYRAVLCTLYAAGKNRHLPKEKLRKPLGQG